VSIATEGPTATVYNRSDGRLTAQRLPDGLRRIAIVGGGSAGWMAAMLLQQAFGTLGARITVLESPTVETIGVGEGSTPWLRGFFEALEIEEAEWMPACHATYKNGIRFAGWSTRPGFESYFHPFASMLDNLTLTQFVQHCHARLRGADVPAHPDPYFLATRLAAEQRGPRPDEDFPFEVWHGYHFDAVLLGCFLQRKAVERGVEHRLCHVAEVLRREDGDLQALRTREGEVVEADFFVDCTGFAQLLIGKALGTPFVSFADNLFNDAAVAIPTPATGALPPETVSTAMRHGWRWEIPLTSRRGNGYVYASAFCSADEAERELRASLGLLDDATPARHLKMRIGRVTEHWNRNCLAVGLSQGFIEPLEATALLFIQRTVMGFIDQAQADLGPAARARFNERTNAHFEGTRDYIVTHFKTNSRSDTDYWRACAANGNLSEPLQELYRLWLSGQGIAREVGKQALGKGYPVFSWYCLLAGTGCFPPQLQAAAARHDLAAIDDFLARSARHFRPHRELLDAIPPRRAGKSLQLYLW